MNRVLLPLLLLAASATARAVEEPSAAAPEPRRFVTSHRLALEGEALAYTATAGEILLRDDDGEPVASLFTIAYTRDGVEQPERRPVSFVFNGGPGSSSVWLHLGLLGPRRVVVEDDGTAAAGPPYALAPNPATLLRATDLVFVDPVGTGYSRALGDKNDDAYWGVDEDADSVAELIRLWLTENRRWGSPKYLIGESYGTIRAAVLVERLQGGLNAVFLNGVVLVSPAMDMATLPFVTDGNDFPFVGHLPSFAAAAWYHDALPEKSGELEDFLEEVVEFASGEYLQALFAGSALEPAVEARVVEKLHRYTGLDPEYLRQTRLRVGALRFTKELLRDRGQTIGLLDSRFLGEDPDDAGEFFARDPSGVGVAGAFVAGIHRLLAEELEVEMDREYRVMNLDANQRWRRPRGEGGLFNGFVATTSGLARGAAANRDFRVMVVSGLHDLTTAFYAARYMMRHSGLAPDRVRIEEYFGGHMMYLYPPTFDALTSDLAEFVTRSP